MLLAVDVGNTNSVFSVSKEKKYYLNGGALLMEI